MTICVCACDSVCASLHMQTGVIYVQCSEMYASCVIWLRPLPTSVLLIQMIRVSQAQWSQTLQLFDEPVKVL